MTGAPQTCLGQARNLAAGDKWAEDLAEHAQHDASVVTAPEKKLIICAPPRTASTFLVRVLEVAQLGRPEEYFGFDHEKIIRRRTDLNKHMDALMVDRAYFEKVLQLRTFDGLFATKLQYWQLNRLFRSALEKELFAGAVVVFLTRQNMQEQAISWAAAHLTQQWGLEAKRIIDDSRFSDQLLHKTYLAGLEFCLQEAAGFMRFFSLSGIQPMYLTSEEITRDPVRTTVRLARLVDQRIDEDAVQSFCNTRQRYSTDANLKQRLREQIAPAVDAGDVFRKSDSKFHLTKLARRKLRARKLRKSGKLL